MKAYNNTSTVTVRKITGYVVALAFGTVAVFACVVAVPYVCVENVAPSYPDCIGENYYPSGSYCDSRDGESGGDDCTVASITVYKDVSQYTPYSNTQTCGAPVRAIMEEVATTNVCVAASVTGSCGY